MHDFIGEQFQAEAPDHIRNKIALAIADIMRFINITLREMEIIDKLAMS